MSKILLEKIAKWYGTLSVVSGISLEIDDGEFVALLGPSGCGKTTTLRMIAGFVEASEGRIFFGDDDVTNLPANKRNTGMVFQGFALFPHMTVAENVAYGLEMRGIAKPDIRRRVTDVLGLVQLEKFSERFPRQLSGGQQQRVALARALVISPHVLLLDEPLSALDAKLRHEVRIQIRQLQQSLGLTTVFVTHDQEEALSLADRLVVMNAGRIEQIGTPSDLYERPATPFVADFIGKTNFFPGKMSKDAFLTDCGLSLNVSSRSPSASLLGVRPEKIRVSAKDQALVVEFGDANVISGTVELVSYLGPSTEYQVRINSERTMLVQQANRNNTSNFGVGQEVSLSVPRDSCLLFESGLPSGATK